MLKKAKLKIFKVDIWAVYLCHKEKQDERANNFFFSLITKKENFPVIQKQKDFTLRKLISEAVC